MRTLRQELRTSLEGQISVSAGSLFQQLASVDAAVTTVEGIWSNNEVLDAMIRDRPEEYTFIKEALFDLSASANAARTVASRGDYDGTAAALEQGRNVLTEASTVIGRAHRVIASLSITTYYSASDRDRDAQALSQERIRLQTALSALENSLKNLRDAAASLETRIANEEASLASAEGARDRALADIRTFEASLRAEEAQMALFRAGSRPADIASAQAGVSQARAELARASAEYGDSVLTAPIAGIITKVNAKKGELASGPVLTLLGESPFRIEMFLSEVDIPKVRLTQAGSINLDAFPDTHYRLRVSEIDQNSTTVDGVEKYRVKLDFVYPHDEFKIGMSGDSEIVTGERTHVVTIPERAVIEDENGDDIVRILQLDGTVTKQRVETGLRAGRAGKSRL